MSCIPPYTPLLYRKNGVCRGILIFLNFAPKHRLWVLASCGYLLELPRRGSSNSNVFSQSNVLINKKNIKKKNSIENFHFYRSRKICILHGHIFIMFLFLRECLQHLLIVVYNKLSA